MQISQTNKIKQNKQINKKPTLIFFSQTSTVCSLSIGGLDFLQIKSPFYNKGVSTHFETSSIKVLIVFKHSNKISFYLVAFLADDFHVEVFFFIPIKKKKKN